MTYRIHLPLFFLLACLATPPLLAQDATGADDALPRTDLTDPAALPPMEEIEQAWREEDYEYVREGLKRRANESGTPFEMYRYGRVLMEGRGGPRDIDGAAEWLSRAATGNNVEAMTLLARMYLSNHEDRGDAPLKMRRNPERAAELLSRAAALGEAEAQYYLSLLLTAGTGVTEDPDAAFTWMLAAARQDFPKAQYELSRFYSRGHGTGKDDTAALDWLTRAAENGHVRAMYFLAHALETGEGAPQNPYRAIDWYTRAAKAGLPIAQRVLGTHYLSGEVVKINAAEGVKWLTLAAKAGDVGAMSNLGRAYTAGTGVDKDAAEAARWYRSAAEYGLGRAMVALAAMHETGTGVGQDFDEALRLYRKALDTTDRTLAETQLGRLAASGALDGKVAPQTAVPWALTALQKDLDGVEDWLAARAVEGDTRAQTGLADHYLATEDQIAKGVALLEQAARGGEAAAQVRLGRMLMQGTHVDLDYVAAHKWFNVAATLGSSEAAELRDAVGALMTPENIAAAQAAARNWFETEEPQPPATEQTVEIEHDGKAGE